MVPVLCQNNGKDIELEHNFLKFVDILVFFHVSIVVNSL
jgi:hypothetical protein